MITKIFSSLTIISMLIILSCAPSPIEVPLVALHNETYTTGKFFLGTGTIDSVEYYYFMYKLPDGGIIKSRIDVSRAVVYETDESPHIEGFPSDIDFGYIVFDKAHFYIPKNSIVYNFAIK